MIQRKAERAPLSTTEAVVLGVTGLFAVAITLFSIVAYVTWPVAIVAWLVFGVAVLVQRARRMPSGHSQSSATSPPSATT